MADIVQRRLAAIIAADVAGYSRLMGHDEVATRTRFNALLEEVVRPAIDRYRGRLVKTMGDGFLVEFGSVVDAVQCAADVQSGAARRQEAESDDTAMLLRIGIHLGDVIVEGDDIHGDGVNVAARLEGLAEPGGIRISEAVFNNVKGKLDLGFADLGPQKVKNIAEPVPAYRVLLDQADAGKLIAAKRIRLRDWRWPALAAAVLMAVLAVASILLWRPWAPSGAGKPSIAVLPLANPSGDPAQSHLGRGIAGDLFTDIARISGLLVASWEASSRIDPDTADLKSVGSRLNVTYVLTGDIRRVGDVLRVNVRLVEAATGFNLWAERYSRNVAEVFALQDDIASKVVAALKLKLTSAEEALIGKRGTANPAAYDLLLRARAEAEQIGLSANAGAIALLEQAIELDPKFAQAYAELAIQYFWKWNIGHALDTSILDRGAEIAGQAIDSDPSLADAYGALGLIDRWRKRHDAAIRSFEYAIKLDPNHSDSFARLGYTYFFLGKPEQGLKYLREARKRTAYEPWWYAFVGGRCYFYLGRHEDAVNEFKASIARNPRAFMVHRVLAMVYMEMGRMDEAHREIAESLRLNPRSTISWSKRILPFKNSADLERELTALRKLGVPE